MVAVHSAFRIRHSAFAPYLRDAMGGHTGLFMDDDGDLCRNGMLPVKSQAGSLCHTQTYDAFGNVMSKTFTAAGSFAWRGAEGSVTDREPNLVYMQARHYDPTIGRFLQPDALLMASLTTQGLNRYIYCGNDPVNKSDPTAQFVGAIPVILFLAAISGAVNAAGGGSFWAGFAGGLVAGVIGTLGPIGAVLGGSVGSGLTSRLNGDAFGDVALSMLVGGILGGGTVGLSALGKWLAGAGQRAALTADGISLAQQAEELYWEIVFSALAVDVEIVTTCFLDNR